MLTPMIYCECKRTCILPCVSGDWCLETKQPLEPVSAVRRLYSTKTVPEVTTDELDLRRARPPSPLAGFPSAVPVTTSWPVWVSSSRRLPEVGQVVVG